MMSGRELPLLLLVVAAILTGCAGGSRTYNELTMDRVDDQIRASADTSGMQAGDAGRLMKLYHIEASDVEDYVLYTAESNVRADELVVIKLKDAGDSELMLERFRQRIEAQTLKFRDYRPEEYHLIERHVLKSEGPFVFFAVSQEAERMAQAFDKALK